MVPAGGGTIPPEEGHCSTAQADHVLAALPDELFPRISEWLISKGDSAIGYNDLKNFLLQRFTPSATSRVTQLLQLAKQPFGDQRPSDALLEMKALARLPPSADGTVRQLDLLRALWLLRLPESIRAVIPNAEEMDEDTLQQMADSLKNAQAAAGRHISVVVPASSTATPQSDSSKDVPGNRLPPSKLLHGHDSRKISEALLKVCATFMQGSAPRLGIANRVALGQNNG